MTNAIRQYDSSRARNMARGREIKALKQSWVDGCELTPDELAEIQPRLKHEFLERQARRSS